MHDGISDIQYRFTLAPGAGDHFIKNKIRDLSLKLGRVTFLRDSTMTLKFCHLARRGEVSLCLFAASPRLWETLEFLPQVENFNNYIANGELGVEAGLNKSEKLLLRTVLQDSYDSIPAAGRLRNDIKLITSVAYKF